MILLLFFSEDNVVSDEINVIVSNISNENERSAFWGTPGIAFQNYAVMLIIHFANYVWI